ncbi:MAG: CBS domain-containing protein [Rhodospirillales bacterium]|jgi:CBS domain-containing protein|nr:CBS domain-containing protein [Rhodospirillales bacterium]MDP6805661.1 CBS domain-containing protein [Rhodospirillales bacterium]
MKVRDIMSINAVRIFKGTTMAEAAELAASTMAVKKMRRLPVVKSGKLVGTVSRGDICKAVLKG